MITVAACARYPVKSLLGETMPFVDLGAGGVVGDRRWALQVPDGRLGSGKTNRRFHRLPRLLEMSARLDDGVAVITLPDGRDVPVMEASAALSEFVGREVTVVEGASFVDDASVHLLTTASVRWWQRQVPDVVVAWQRARPNLLLDAPGDEREEDGWAGRHVSVGSVLLEVVEPTVRCVMVSQAQPGLPADSRLLASLEPADLTLGVYARVVDAGRVDLGDPVSVR